MFMVSNKMS